MGGRVGGEEVGWREEEACERSGGAREKRGVRGKRRRVREEGRVKDGRGGVDGKGSNCPFNC